MGQVFLASSLAGRIVAVKVIQPELARDAELLADGPRVIDFGIARATTESRLTATGSVIGTPSYMSPEQVEGQVAGPPSDVFSLGSVLAFAGSGTAPFTAGPGGSHASVMYRVVYGEADLSAVDGSVRELVEACLAKDPARRPDLGKVTAYCAEMAEYVGLSAAAFWPAGPSSAPSPRRLVRQRDRTQFLQHAQQVLGGIPVRLGPGLPGLFRLIRRQLVRGGLADHVRGFADGHALVLGQEQRHHQRPASVGEVEQLA